MTMTNDKAARIAQYRREQRAESAWHKAIDVASDPAEHEAMRRIMRPAGDTRLERLQRALPFSDSDKTYNAINEAIAAAIDALPIRSRAL